MPPNGKKKVSPSLVQIRKEMLEAGLARKQKCWAMRPEIAAYDAGYPTIGGHMVNMDWTDVNQHLNHYERELRLLQGKTQLPPGWAEGK